MDRFEKRVVTYTATCHGLVHVLELTYGVLLLGIAEEFGASLFVLGILANVMGFAFGASSIPIGFIADRQGERGLLILCCLGMGLSAIVIGLSPNIYILGVGLLALGIALGIYHPTAAAFISRVVRHRGLGFGYQGVGGNVGVALGPILASLIASFLGWRAAYFTFAIPTIMLAVLFFFTLRSEVRTTEQPATEVRVEKVSWRPIILPIALILSCQIFNGFVYRALVTFLPLYLSERIHVTFLSSMLVAGSFTSIALMFGVGGQLLGGYLSERISRESLGFIILLVAIPLLIVIGNTSGVVLLLTTIVFAFFHFMTQPVFNVLLADYSPSQWRGRIFGSYFFCSFGVGSFSASSLGYVAERVGINWVFIISAGFALLSLIGMLGLWARARVRKRAATTAGSS